MMPVGAAGGSCAAGAGESIAGNVGSAIGACWSFASNIHNPATIAIAAAANNGHGKRLTGSGSMRASATNGVSDCGGIGTDAAPGGGVDKDDGGRTLP